MEGEEERSEKEGSFSKASILKRIAIVAAGAIVIHSVPPFYLAIGTPARIKPLPDHLKVPNKF